MTETLSAFQMKISLAELAGDEWVETTPDVINLVCKGLKDQRYFTYGRKGIKVCAYGDREKIEEAERIQLGESIFGTQEGKVLGR